MAIRTSIGYRDIIVFVPAISIVIIGSVRPIGTVRNIMGGLGCLAESVGLVADHSGFADTPVLFRVRLDIGDCLPYILGQRELFTIYCSRVRNRNDNGLGGGLDLGHSLVHDLAARRINFWISFTAALDDAGNDMIGS